MNPSCMLGVGGGEENEPVMHVGGWGGGGEIGGNHHILRTIAWLRVRIMVWVGMSQQLHVPVA